MVTSLSTTLVDDEDGDAEAPRDERSAYLFLLIECDRPRAGGSRHELHGVRSVAIGRASERRVARGAGALDLRIPDGRMSSNHARLTSIRGQWVLEDGASRNGTRVNGEFVERATLKDGDLLEVGRTLLLFREDLPKSVQPDLDWATSAEPLLTLDPGQELEFERLRKIATAKDLCILIEGESGTGKEVLAHRIKTWSGRSGNFVAVNCGALPENLVESELFGATRGAYSGAVQERIGFVRAADRGCLFLDEVAELPLVSQATLLRVLQEHEVVPVGGTRPIAVDLQVLAATHQRLETLVTNGRFRQDLFARINGFRTRLLPLRDRRQDFGILIAALLDKNEQAPTSVRFTTDAIRALLGYPWPLNVRELAHALTAAVLLTPDGLLDVEHFPKEIQHAPASGPPPPLTEDQTHQREELIGLLRKHQGNVSAIARELGKARMQVQRWLKRYDLDAEGYRE